MRSPFRRRRRESEHGGVGPTAASAQATRGDGSRIPDGFPSVLIMQSHPDTGQSGSFVYLHSRVPGRESEYELTEINPRTGEVISRFGPAGTG